ncbi:hypothetical protein BWQ93_17910 [Sphingopyxis sp. QXT-31]|uniref:hypothetical protein n=1 Tax=Sphingopyxis sp. QXT-31 TaxID=1357916 RepID=UPI0009797D2D|nr:hypothetical protein [Sphingopyxis sp. QXT-31]AQA00135.1 hypothetical protein BWQ93_17910 [Sphingopyxis sp. QXT-31]
MAWNPFRRKGKLAPIDREATRHVIANRNSFPIYVSVEPWPECFELEPEESLTLVVGDAEAAIEVQVIDERELVIYPASVDIDFLIDGKPAEDRSWQFRHER